MLLFALVLGFCLGQRLNRDVSFAQACSSDTLTILGVGDFLLHGPLQQTAYRAKSFLPLWSDVLPVLKQAGLMYGNQEVPTAKGLLSSGKSTTDPGMRFDNAVYSGFPMFNCHPQLVSDIKSSGWDVVSTANNHALDRRWQGADATIEQQDAAGLKHTGVRHTSTGVTGAFHTIVEKNGWKVAFLACTFGTNGIPDTRNQVLLCYEHRDLVLRTIRELAARPDIDAVIATPHWGNEYQDDPQPKEIGLARELVEAGATSVIGTHPHVVQPWEKYTTRDGREALIAYSTGNFVSNQKEWKKALALGVFLGLSRAPGRKAWVHGVQYHPMTMINVPGTLKLVSLPRTPQYDQVWTHVFKLVGSDRLLERTGTLDTCSRSATRPRVVPDVPVVVAAEECIRDSARAARAQAKLIALGHLGGRADGIWGRGSQGALDKWAASKGRPVKTCLTREHFDLLDAESI